MICGSLYLFDCIIDSNNRKFKKKILKVMEIEISVYINNYYLKIDYFE